MTTPKMGFTNTNLVLEIRQFGGIVAEF